MSCVHSGPKWVAACQLARVRPTPRPETLIWVELGAGVGLAGTTNHALSVGASLSLRVLVCLGQGHPNPCAQMVSFKAQQSSLSPDGESRGAEIGERGGGG